MMNFTHFGAAFRRTATYACIGRGLDAFVGVRDHQLHAAQAVSLERPELTRC